MTGIRQRCVALALIIQIQAGLACRGGSPVTPEAMASGTWHGRIIDAAAGEATLDLVLTQTASTISGTWSANFQHGVADLRAGSVKGTVVAANATLFLERDRATACSATLLIRETFAFFGRMSDGHLTGTYVANTCVGSNTGAIDALRTR